MSVSSMANLAFARRNDVATGARADRKSTKDVAKKTGQTDATSNSTTSALATIAAYIPTEVLTVYVAILAALGVTVPSAATSASSPSTSPLASASVAPVTTAAPVQSAPDVAVAAFTPLPIYLLFIILVPVVVWALYARNAKSANKPLPKSIGAWPKWEMIAGTVAFATWAAALPSSPLGQFSWFSAAVAGIAALVVSMLIGVLAPLFASQTLKNS